MKCFSQCTNCQQWYVRTYTTSVEIYQHDNLCYLTVWCLRCVEEAERRSQPPDTAVVTGGAPPSLHAAGMPPPGHAPPSEIFQQFMQEHQQIMDRALYDDEAILVPVIQEFLERCRLYQMQLDTLEQSQRLTGHMQYWATFLKALNS